MKLSISLAGVRSITPITEIGVHVRELHVEIHEYDVNKVEIKYKLIVTFNLIEDLRTICTLLYLVLWQILFVCLYINYRYDVTKYLLQFNCASDRQCWDFGLSFWTCVCRLEIASIEFLCGYKTLFLSIP